MKVSASLAYQFLMLAEKTFVEITLRVTCVTYVSYVCSENHFTSPLASFGDINFPSFPNSQLPERKERSRDYLSLEGLIHLTSNLHLLIDEKFGRFGRF